MGRAFEYRRKSKEKRWGMMAKAFTKIGKEITLAVKSGGPNPEANTRLKVAMQNAKGVSMPKDKVENAIKRAVSKEADNLAEATYEGYGPNGVAIFVDCVTDNPTRTVANVRLIFSKGGGQLGQSGSLAFIFDKKASFRVEKGNLSLDDLELELIDAGLEEIFEEDGEIVIYTTFQDFNNMQKALEEKGVNIINSEFTRLPNTTAKISAEDAEKIEKIIDKLEEDEDVDNVYHNMEIID